MEQIIALLKALLTLLLLVSTNPAVPEDVRQQTYDLASSTVIAVQTSLPAASTPATSTASGTTSGQTQPSPTTDSSSAPSPAPAASPSPAPVINNEPTTMSPQPQPTPAPEPPAPKSQARIEIVSPTPGKGLGRAYKANPSIVLGENPDGSTFVASAENYDESNYIVLGAVVFDDEGKPTSDADVVVTVNGEKPVTIHGTGAVFPYYVDGSKRVYPVYTFQYEFRDSGKVIVAFATKGMRESVTLDVK